METVKGFRNDEIPKTQVENNTYNDIGTELKSNSTITDTITTNKNDISTPGIFSSLDLGDYVSGSFPVPVIPQIHEKKMNEVICEPTTTSMNSTIPQVPKYNVEETREKEKNVKFIETNDNINDNNVVITESGLDFSDIINNLPGWKSFISLVKRNVD